MAKDASIMHNHALTDTKGTGVLHRFMYWLIKSAHSFLLRARLRGSILTIYIVEGGMIRYCAATRWYHPSTFELPKTSKLIRIACFLISNVHVLCQYPDVQSHINKPCGLRRILPRILAATRLIVFGQSMEALQSRFQRLKAASYFPKCRIWVLSICDKLNRGATPLPGIPLKKKRRHPKRSNRRSILFTRQMGSCSQQAFRNVTGPSRRFPDSKCRQKCFNDYLRLRLLNRYLAATAHVILVKRSEGERACGHQELFMGRIV